MSSGNTSSGQIRQNHLPQQQDADFYSVELSIQELKMLYQFKIWNFSAEPMFIVVKDDSALLDQLKVGTVFKSKYYRTDSICSTVELETQIKQIARDKQGRFKGHYLIELAIINGAHSQTIH